MGASETKRGLKFSSTSWPSRTGCALFLCNISLWSCGAFAADSETASANEANLSAEGSVQLRNAFQVKQDQSLQDNIIKNELRATMRLKYGSGDFGLFARPDLKLSSDFFDEGADGKFTYSSETRQGRNGMLSARTYELAFNELYVSKSFDGFRVRAGNQIYSWGTSDVFSPTSYFNPSDYREFILKSQEESRLGVPSVSSVIFGNGYTVELVVAPYHVPPLLPAAGDYWQFNADNFKLPVVLQTGEPLDKSPGHASYGARLASSIAGADTSVSIFHGVDKDPLYVPVGSLLMPGKPVALSVEPQYKTMNALGVDFSKALDKFVFHLEGAYVPDKAATEKQPVNDVNTMEFPFTVKRVPFHAYTAGFNYFVPLNKLIEGHEGETVFTTEWYQAGYDTNTVFSPLLSNLLVFRFQDTYFEGRLGASITQVADTRYGGRLLWPEMSYRFESGMSLSLSYTQVSASPPKQNEVASAFYYYRGHNVASFGAKYDF